MFLIDMYAFMLSAGIGFLVSVVCVCSWTYGMASSGKDIYNKLVYLRGELSFNHWHIKKIFLFGMINTVLIYLVVLRTVYSIILHV